VVFTLPSELRGLARSYPRSILRALFHAASETLVDLGHSRLGADLGITMVLHTWTRDLRLHPHVHAIVTAGGLALDSLRWVHSPRKYLFPVEVMGTLLRAKMMDRLRTLHRRGEFDSFDAFGDPEGFDRWMARLARTPWLVYAKKPFGQTDHVLKYLGRYTHRVGIANSRLVDVTDDRVTFRTKHGKTVTLSPVDFLRRFIQHVLPPGFVKIRHYGLFAGGHVLGKLEAARRLLTQRIPLRTTADALPAGSWIVALRALTGFDVDRCRLCGGVVDHRPVSRPTSRAPP
jgi:hypothetical protein